MPEIVPTGTAEPVVSLVGLTMRRSIALRGLGISTLLGIIAYCVSEFLQVRGVTSVLLSRVCLVIIGVCVFLIWLILTPNQGKLLRWIGLPVIASLMIGVDLWVPRPKLPEAHIDAQMIVEPADSNGKTSFRFDLHNPSEVGIHITGYLISANGNSDQEQKLADPLFLIPGDGHATIQAPPLFFLEQGVQKVQFAAAFSPSQGEQKIASFQFLLKPEDVRAQTIYPTGMSELEGVVLNGGAAATQLGSLEQGTAFLVLEEKVDGKPNVVNFHDDKKKFSFDPMRRLVTWTVKTDSGSTLKLEKPLPKGNSIRHLIVLLWDCSNGTSDLMVDQ